jgi:hypothetical protein
MRFPVLKNLLLTAATFCLLGNIASAESVPPPPPLPTGNAQDKQQTIPAKKTVPASQGGNVVVPAPRPPGKKQGGKPRPEVTIIPGKTETRAEYRANGILYMIKVTPRSRGKRTYYLVDQHGDGVFVRSNFKPKKTIPKWVLNRSD